MGVEMVGVNVNQEENGKKNKNQRQPPKPHSRILPLYIFSRTSDELSTIILLSIPRCTALYIA